MAKEVKRSWIRCRRCVEHGHSCASLRYIGKWQPPWSSGKCASPQTAISDCPEFDAWYGLCLVTRVSLAVIRLFSELFYNKILNSFFNLTEYDMRCYDTSCIAAQNDIWLIYQYAKRVVVSQPQIMNATVKDFYLLALKRSSVTLRARESRSLLVFTVKIIKLWILGVWWEDANGMSHHHPNDCTEIWSRNIRKVINAISRPRGVCNDSL